MIEVGAVVAGLSALVTQTVTETTQAESSSSLAKLFKKDIGAAFQQQVFKASQQYFHNYQKRHGTLKVTCVRMDTPMELEQLYTTVRLLNRSDLEYFESIDGLSSQYRKSGRRGFQYQDKNKQDGIAVANQEEYMMVLGGPGIGKSTLLRKVGLEAFKGQNGTFEHLCMPVFLPLQRFKSVDMTIEQRIVEELRTCGFPEPEAVTAAMLRKGRLLVLLDGLDEVPKAQEDEVIEQIRDFVDRHGKNRFIASCRIAAYKGGFPRFKDVTIAPFEDPQIQEFIGNWFSGERDQSNATADQCWELLKRPEYKAAKELAQTPLLLTLLCAVYDKQLDFPKNRASLYGSALDVVLKEWAAEKRIHNQPIYRDLPLELELELLSEMAFNSFVDDQLFFDKRDVTHGIKTFLIDNLNVPKHLDSEAVLEAIEVQQGILVERARDVYSFSHLTFQEYLTAKYIVNNDQVTWLVNKHLTDERWREVFLLVAGLMRGRQGADTLLEVIERRSTVLLKGESLKYLIAWAITATAQSANTAKPAAKRAAVIVLTLSLARSLSRDRASAPALARALALHFALALALALDRDRAFALALDRDRALDLALSNIA
ncbi:MAG: NACHT domain-containing protein [Synechococcales cyanobacterium K44_A2020_017]|nr:NACHT domain-containing protein [Synechococcales cyanobacterium K32_A2020_035]MBF2095185.1 NACHT domain-containing protein [Synechococcales cyanobacterium K44_A2020_017]